MSYDQPEANGYVKVDAADEDLASIQAETAVLGAMMLAQGVCVATVADSVSIQTARVVATAYKRSDGTVVVIVPK